VTFIIKSAEKIKSTEKINKLGFERKARLFCDLFHFYLQKFIFFKMLGFERKARLFCDCCFININLNFSSHIMLGFERKARLFCDKLIELVVVSSLGFERKARLFCDAVFANLKINRKTFVISCWDLSVRLGYFVTVRLKHCRKFKEIVGI